MRRMLGRALLAAMLLLPASVLAQADSTARSAPRQDGRGEGVEGCESGGRCSLWNAFHVRETLEDGTFVALDDGTVWEIYLPDRTSTVSWRAGDLALVRVSPASSGSFDYVLINGEDDTRARARLGTPERSAAEPASLEHTAP